MKPTVLPFAAGASLAALAAACSDPAAAPRSPRAPAAADVAAAAAPALTQSDGVPVMTKLDNPRGLAWAPDGALYVAESGRGGTGPCTIVLGSTVCYGPTGGVSRLADGVQDRVVDGLPSWVVTSNKTGRAQGPNGISVHGQGGMYVAIGFEADPRLRDAAPELGQFARLVHVSPTALVPGNGRSHAGGKHEDWEFVADPGAYEIATNPDCGVLDSDPFGVLALGNEVLIMDAGANALVRLGANGEMSTVAAFPSKNSTGGAGCPAKSANDFVPTSVVQGPDGALYLGHLGGLPIIAGSSSVWRLAEGGTPEVYCTGFTWVIALAFGADGTLYVLQHSDGPTTNGPGSLVRVGPGCERTKVVTGLNRPTGLAVGEDGAVYISLINGANFAAEGQVRRFTP